MLYSRWRRFYLDIDITAQRELFTALTTSILAYLLAYLFIYLIWTGTSKKVTEYNLPRRCIRRYFPDRKCFVFPLPVHCPSDMSRLDELTEQQLAPQFVAMATDFCDHILQSPVKVVGGLEFNGRGACSRRVKYLHMLSHVTYRLCDTFCFGCLSGDNWLLISHKFRSIA